MKLTIIFVLTVAVITAFVCLGRYIVSDVSDLQSSRPCNQDSVGCEVILPMVKTSYDEGKDLSKSFLTLIGAVFVASITFSEKIIDLKTAGPSGRVAMVTCWLSLLLSVAACGTGLV